MIKSIHLATSTARHVRPLSLNSALSILVDRLLARANPHAGGLLLGRPDKSPETCTAAVPVSVAFETLQDKISEGACEQVRLSEPGAACGQGREPPRSALLRKVDWARAARGHCADIGRIRDAKWCVDVCRCIDRGRPAMLGAPDPVPRGTVLPTLSGKSARTEPFPLVQTPRDIQSAILGRRQMERSTQPKLLGAPVSMCPANAALICPSDDTVRVLEGVTQEQMAT